MAWSEKTDTIVFNFEHHHPSSKMDELCKDVGQGFANCPTRLAKWMAF